MKSAQILRKKIQSNELTLGMIVIDHLWPGLIEILRNAGFDYAILDQEHSAFDAENIAQSCALGRVLDFAVLVRPPETDFSLIRRAGDLGPCGFLLPSVENAAMMNAARDALYMPPRGKRRPGGPGNRWPKDFQYATWRREVEDDFIVLPQIETLEGLRNADAIAAHEITTAIAIGPYDLSANLGVCWEPKHPKLLEAIERIRQAGRTAGKNMWMIGDAAQWIPRGFTFLCTGEPAGFMEAALKASVAALRAGQGKA
jgi:2-keto-3-deoxy-L-rhamnonate aldolase RhmA